jgi:hypothetical protein
LENTFVFKKQSKGAVYIDALCALTTLLIQLVSKARDLKCDKGICDGTVLKQCMTALISLWCEKNEVTDFTGQRR